MRPENGYRSGRTQCPAIAREARSSEEEFGAPMLKLAYTILYVSDVRASLAFYERAFGLRTRFLHESGTYGELETGATAIAFADAGSLQETGLPFETASRSSRAPGFELGLLSDDVERDFARAVEAGALPIQAPSRKPWGQTVSYVRDLDGFLVEICSVVS